MIGVVVAVAVLASAVVLWRHVMRREAFARPAATQTPLRGRQLQREADESAPITWRR